MIAAVAACCLLPDVQAQNATNAVITKGEKATFYIIMPAGGARRVGISPDGKYLGGGYPTSGGEQAPGFIYDFEKDSTWLAECSAEHIVSPDLYTGRSNMIFRNGELIEVETPMAGDDVAIWAVSLGLDTVVMMGHEEEMDPYSGSLRTVNYPYVVDGKTGKILHRLEPHWPMTDEESNSGYGARVNAASADGLVLVGHSCWSEAPSNWSPVLWDLQHDTSLFFGTDDRKAGSLAAISHDGTIIGGEEILYFYDRENLTFTRREIPLQQGMSSADITDISANGWVLMYQSEDMNTREGYLYNIETEEIFEIEEYVRELYGLESPISYFTPVDISEDGRMISGWSMYQGAYVPYCVVLEETQILARPRSFTASQAAGDMAIAMSWQAPMKGQYTVLGYNVFCDSVQLNAEMIPAEEREFMQTEGVEAGIHEYAVQAVYAEGVSSFSQEVRLMVVEEGGCVPVQEIGSILTYNRYVDIYWGLPSARMAQTMQTGTAWDGTLRAGVSCSEPASGRMVRNVREAKSYRNEGLDLIDIEALEGYGYSCGLVIGNRLYVGEYESPNLSVYNLFDMTKISVSTIGGISGISNMAYEDGHLYLASTQKEILDINMETMSVRNHLMTDPDVEVRYLCYIPELNEGKGGFAYGDWTSIRFCNKMGQEIEPGVDIDIAGLAIAGTAYYDGKLYLFSQSGEKMAELYVVDFATGEFLKKMDLSENNRLNTIEPTYGFMAGGLSMNVLEDSTIVLGAMLQFSAENSRLAFLEVESAPGLLGYNLYRNGEQINPEGEYIQGHAYQDVLTEAGTYTYTVEAVSEGCTSKLDEVKTEVVITPVGECSGPSSLTAVESSASAMLSWDYTATSTTSLVGFNVYRDGELLQEGVMDMKYTDYNLAKGDYTYRVEAFHSNSCTASDSVEITITMEGRMMPPSAFSLSKKQAEDGLYQVDASWDLPFFEDPLALGYCNLPMSGTALESGEPIWVLVGWDSAGLEPYRDLYIVGMEFFIGEGIIEVDGLVYLNDTLALQMPMSSRVQENAWNTIMFNQYIPMDQPMEALVGYKVTYEDKTKPVVVYDMGPAVVGAGDLVSTDGQQWTMLSASGISANWCINALVVNKRDLENAAKTGRDPLSCSLVKSLNMKALNMTESVPVAQPKASSESVKLLGFNLYRDDAKLNAEPLTLFSYADTAVPAGSYEYCVSAVYQEGEVKGESILIDVNNVGVEALKASSLRLYPNPASEQVYVEGEYAAVEILSLSGRMQACYEDGRAEIPLAGLAAGAYMMRFTLLDGTVQVCKLIVER